MKKFIYIVKHRYSECYQLNDLDWHIVYEPLLTIFFSFLATGILQYCDTLKFPKTLAIFGIAFILVYASVVINIVLVVVNNNLMQYKAGLVNRLQMIKTIVINEKNFPHNIEKEKNPEYANYVNMHLEYIKEEIKGIASDMTDYISCSCYSDDKSYNSVHSVCQLYRDVSDKTHYDDILKILEYLELHIIK